METLNSVEKELQVTHSYKPAYIKYIHTKDFENSQALQNLNSQSPTG